MRLLTETRAGRAIVVVAFLAAVAANPRTAAVFGLIAVVEGVGTVAHELGHLLAAKAVGYRIDELRVGYGRRLWLGTIRDIPVVVRALPFTGHVRFTSALHHHPMAAGSALHACTDPLDGMKPNDRARDLPDILTLAALIRDDYPPSVRDACHAVFAARGGHAWPPVLVIQPHWSALYKAAILGLEDLPNTVEEAAEAVRAFIRHVDESP
jgi:membrane-associated protease RseP (regulator of RpoE activity)